MTEVLGILALVGAWRQHGYGNLRLREGVLLGVLAVGGSVAGVAIANAVPERALEVSFACLVLFVAFRLAKRSFEPERPRPARAGSRAGRGSR